MAIFQTNNESNGRPPPVLGNVPFKMEQSQEFLETFLSRWSKVKSSWKRSFQDGAKSRAFGNVPFRMEQNQEL